MLSAVTGKQDPQWTLRSWKTRSGRTVPRLFYENVHISNCCKFSFVCQQTFVAKILYRWFPITGFMKAETVWQAQFLLPFANTSVMKDDKRQCKSQLLWKELVPVPKGKHSLFSYENQPLFRAGKQAGTFTQLSSKSSLEQLKEQSYNQGSSSLGPATLPKNHFLQSWPLQKVNLLF